MEDLANLIRQTADRVRMRDFLWGFSISIGIILVLVISETLTPRTGVLVAAVFLAGFAIQYRFSAGRLWAEPIQRIIEAELGEEEAELAALRLARKIAQVLPEPLLLLERDGTVVSTNAAAEKFVNRTDVEGRHLASVLRAAPVFDAFEMVTRENRPTTVEFEMTGSVNRFCRAYVAPLDQDSEDDRILVMIRDLTTEHRIEQMRVDFIAAASHELRTPLASLVGYIETLRGPAKGDPEAQKKFLKIMQKQAERMQRLVSDLMSLSKIELNEHIAPVGIVDLRDIIEEVMDGLRPMIEKSEADVSVAIDGTVAMPVRADRDEILQAAQNLVHNALKYGGEPPRIMIRLGYGEAPGLTAQPEAFERTGDSAIQTAARLGHEVEGLAFLQVRDHGPGIDRSDLPRLTERFYRVNIERSRKTGGTGLGLAIVKHIINRHKGGLQVESRAGVGTAFTCYLASAATDRQTPPQRATLQGDQKAPVEIQPQG